jgi:CelD/BcsL family acetyltransferase involved in cellulose biosynthesis
MPSGQGVKAALIRDLELVGHDGLDDAAQPCLFNRLEWFRRTWRHCAPGREPLVVRASDGGAAAWLFLVKQDGMRATGLASWYTLSYRPVFAGNTDAETQMRLLSAIAARLHGEVARVSLDNVPPDSATQITDAFGQAGWRSFVADSHANWTHDVHGQSFADYWAARPGQLRSTVKRKGAKSPLAIAIRHDFDSGSWAAYADVYANSWKPEEGSLSFLRAMAESKGSTGRLRLGVATLDGRAVAAQLWTVEAGTAIIHKLAHRTGLDALSPGTLLTRAMFEHVIDREHVDRIDFGTGDDRYKADWMTTRTMLQRLDLYDLRSVRGAMGAATRLAARALGR